MKLFGILKTVWSDGVQCLWRLNKNVTQLLGVEIKAFVRKCPDIATLLTSKEGGLAQTTKIVSLARALDLWYHIEYHLKRAEVAVEDVEEFPRVLDRFEANINEFYQCGTETFLSGKGIDIGDEETYYLHALKYYIPKHARKIWDTHKLGIGIFTMQGFEPRYKESKNIMKRFNNKKHNICSQILQRLWDYFSHNNDYKNNKGKKEIVESIVEEFVHTLV